MRSQHIQVFETVLAEGVQTLLEIVEGVHCEGVFPNVRTQIDHLIEILVDYGVKYMVTVGLVLVEVASKVGKSHSFFDRSGREPTVGLVIGDSVPFVHFIFVICVQHTLSICPVIDTFSLSLWFRSVSNT